MAYARSFRKYYALIVAVGSNRPWMAAAGFEHFFFGEYISMLAKHV